jgi:putative ABC transport system substrate-binding protein
MNRRRKLVIALGAGVLTAPLACLSQQQGKVRRIGFLAVRSRSTPSNPDIHYDAFVQEMRRLGYVEGKSLDIEWRFADGKYERFPALAAELVRLKPEVIVTHTTAAGKALQQATSSIPIVMANVADPVLAGLATNLARPGGNITGLSLMLVDLSAKYLELLKLMLPALSRVAVLANPDNPSHSVLLKNIQTAAQQLGVKVLPMDARTPEEIERAFSTMRREFAEAVIILSDAFLTGRRRQISELAARYRLPLMLSYPEQVEVDGLMGYGQNLVDFYRRAAYYVDGILKGANPGDLPMEQPTTIKLSINRRTAKALGLTIPQELLLRADEVFE